MSCSRGGSSSPARVRSWRTTPSPGRSIWASGSDWTEGRADMEMKPGLSMQQKPMLIMTHRLQQALKAELERNPRLEEVDEVEESQELEDVKKEVGQNESETPEAPPADEKAEEKEADWNEL